MSKDLFRFISMAGSITLGFALLWAILFGISQKNLKEQVPSQRLESLINSTPFQLGPASALAKSFRMSWANKEWTYSTSKRPVVTLGEETTPIPNVPTFIYLEGAPEGRSLKKLKELFSNYKDKEDLIFLCSSDATLKELRSLAPKWSYGTGQTFLSRLLFFSSMKLLGLLSVPGDVLHIQDIRALTKAEAKALLSFAQRHNKVLIFGEKNNTFANQKYSVGLTP